MIRIALLTFTLAATALPTGGRPAAPVRAGEVWSADAEQYTMAFESCGSGLCARLVGTTDPGARSICGELILHSLEPEGDGLVGRFLDYAEGRERPVVLVRARGGTALSLLDSLTEPSVPLVRTQGKPADVAGLCSPGRR